MEALKATAYHEAGHAVMAWIQKVRLKGASIIADKDSAGHCLHEKLLKIREGGLLLTPRGRDCGEKHILICLAGGVAQTQFNPQGTRRSHMQADWDEAAAVALVLNNGDGKGTGIYLEWLVHRAKNLIALRQNWLLVEAVAPELFCKTKLTGREVEALIRQSYDDQLLRQKKQVKENRL
jgi:hypothetical protein